MSLQEDHALQLRYARFPIGMRLLYLLLFAVGLVFAAFVIITPFDLQSQAAFGVFTAVVYFVVNKFQTRLATLIIVALSALVSTRYL